MSRAPGTCMMDGALYESKTMSAYARSCTTRMSCSRASAITRSKNAKSTQCAVGFDGKPITSIFGLGRSEEHTSELQSRLHLVCRLLLEKKKKKNNTQ